jgi:hypothetical protein
MYLLDSDHLSILQRQLGPEFEALADMTVAVKTWMHELYSVDPMIRSESAGFEGNHGGDLPGGSFECPVIGIQPR